MPSSTTLNSQEGGYGSIKRNGSDDSEASPLIGNAAADDTKGSDATIEYVICFKRARNLLLGALLGIILLLVGGGTLIPRKRIRTGIRVPNDEAGNPHNLPSVSLLRDESFQVSPTKHMGMLSLEREGDALPSSVWGSHLDGQPLPTNSWYLVCASNRLFAMLILLLSYPFPHSSVIKTNIQSKSIRFGSPESCLPQSCVAA